MINGMDESNPPHEGPTVDVIAARPIHLPARVRSLMAPPVLEQLSRREAGLDLGLIVLVALVLPIGPQVFLDGLITDMPDVPHVFLIIYKAFDALLLIGLAGYLLWRQGIAPASLGLQTSRLGRQVLWSVPTLGAVYAVFVVVMMVIVALVIAEPGFQEDLDHRAKFLDMLPINSTLDTILLMTQVAIHEELLFRALMIPYLRRLTGSWVWAVLISSVLFASLHLTQGWLGAAQILAVGAVLGTFFVLSRSALAVIIAHFVFNFLQTQMARYVLPWVDEVTESM